MKNSTWKNKVKALVAMSLLASALTVAPVTGEAASKVKIVRSDMPVKVLYNARQVASDVKPKVVEGAVLVPIRFIGEKIGSKITVAKNNKDIRIEKGSKVVDVTINSNVAMINGKKVTLNAKVLAESGRTLVPLQALNGLGVPVEWDAITRFVWVGHKNVPTLEEVASKEQEIKPYLGYFKKQEYMLNIDGTNERNKVSIINNSLLPFKVDSRIYYRYDLAYDNNGGQYIKATTTDKGIMETSLAFLTKDKLLVRPAILNLRESLSKDIRIHYYPVVSISDYHYYDIKNYSDIKLNDVKYIYIGLPFSNVVLLENSWR